MTEPGLPPEWRTWVAENLLRGVPPEQLEATLLQHDQPPAAVQAELAAAATHPYLAAGRALARELTRRRWLLDTLAELAALDPATRRLARTPLPPFAEFLRDHYAANRPGLFAGAAADWPARRWTPESLRAAHGAAEIEVQAGRAGDPRYEQRSHRLKRRTTLAAFLEQIVAAGDSNDLYLTANNAGVTSPALAPLFDDVGQLGDGYLDLARLREGAFLWIGPAGVVTPLHHDLTNNLMVQLYGRKRVRLVPAAEVTRLYNDHHVYSQLDLLDLDLERFPEARRLTIVDVTLEPGDALFLPVGWWHHVVGLDLTIGLSFTCFAAPNAFPRPPEPSPDADR